MCYVILIYLMSIAGLDAAAVRIRRLNSIRRFDGIQRDDSIKFNSLRACYSDGGVPCCHRRNESKCRVESPLHINLYQ